jgi:hypothetical protein
MKIPVAKFFPIFVGLLKVGVIAVLIFCFCDSVGRQNYLQALQFAAMVLIFLPATLILLFSHTKRVEKWLEDEKYIRRLRIYSGICGLLFLAVVITRAIL